MHRGRNGQSREDRSLGSLRRQPQMMRRFKASKGLFAIFNMYVLYFLIIKVAPL